MEESKKKILWVISVLLILMSISFLSEVVIPSLLLLAVGIVLLPPVNKKIKEKIQDEQKIEDYKNARNIIAITLSLLFFVSVGSTEDNNQKNNIGSEPVQNSIEQQIKATDTPNAKETKETKKETETKKTTKTNGKYTGEKVKGKKHGYGTYKWNDGSVYKGNFKDDKIHGKGVLTIPKKGKYSGNFSKGKKNGYGTYTFSNGDVYIGNWKNDKMSGYGTYKFKNGEKYVGNFSNNKFNGKGTYTKNGKKYSGTWEDNQYIK